VPDAQSRPRLRRSFHHTKRKRLLRTSAIADTCEAIFVLSHTAGKQESLLVMWQTRVVFNPRVSQRATVKTLVRSPEHDLDTPTRCGSTEALEPAGLFVSVPRALLLMA